MNTLKNWILLSCLKATELIEKRLHFGLSFRERLALRLHVSMCKACQQYEKQSLFLDKELARQLDHKELIHDIDQLKLKINRELEKTANS